MASPNSGDFLPVGSVEVLRPRVYPLDPMTADHPSSTEVAVEPGEYPVYRDADAYYWMFTGRINSRAGRKIGDGLIVLGGPDQGAGPQVTFPSRRYGPKQLAEFLADPVCVEGPDQRLRFTLPEGVGR